MQVNTTVQALQENGATLFRIRGRPLLDVGVVALARALPANTSLKTRSMVDCKIGAAGAAALARARTTNAALKSLNLALSGPGGAGGKALAGALATSNTLTTLLLRQTQIDGDGLAALAGALATNTAPKPRNGHALEDGNVEVTTLARVLAAGTDLPTFLVNCDFWDEAGAEAVAEAFTTNTARMTLNLNGGRVCYAGAMALARALPASTSLATISLANCSTGAAGTIALAEALETNTAMKTLDLKCTKPGIT